jgi:putative peptidoglycan lipid II flippase
MSGLARSTLLITAFTVLGMGLQFFSNMFIAARFGAGEDMDMYMAATTLPTLAALILGGSLVSTFLPVFAEYRQKDVLEGWKIVSTFINLSALVSSVFCAAAMFYALPLSKAMAPGLSPGQLSASADLMRWLLPGIVLTVINELVSSVFYSNKRFLEPMLIKVIAPLLTILYVAAFASSLSLRSLVFATLTSGAVQTCILMFGLFREKTFHYSFSLDWRHPGVRKILGLMLPLVLGQVFYKILPGFDRWLASGMPVGSISHLSYATRLTSVVQPIIVSGISITGFSLMSDLAAKRDMPALKAAMARTIGFLLFLSVPLALMLCAFGEPVISLLFERGAFTSQDTRATYLAFAIYALSLPATTVGSVIGQGFYIFQDTRTPAILGVFEIAAYMAMCLALASLIGFLAIPASYDIYFYLSCLVLGWLLARKTGFSILRLIGPPLFSNLAVSALALAAGLALSMIARGSRPWEASCLGISFVSYLILQKFVFRRPEADLVFAIPRKLFSRWAR